MSINGLVSPRPQNVRSPQKHSGRDGLLLRRTVVVSMENLDIRVQFHPDRLPRAVEWAVWNGLDGPIVASEPVELDSQFAVHRFLRFAQQTVAGFRWEW